VDFVDMVSLQRKETEAELVLSAMSPILAIKKYYLALDNL
jgi:hypothetical protein